MTTFNELAKDDQEQLISDIKYNNRFIVFYLKDFSYHPDRLLRNKVDPAADLVLNWSEQQLETLGLTFVELYQFFRWELCDNILDYHPSATYEEEFDDLKDKVRNYLQDTQPRAKAYAEKWISEIAGVIQDLQQDLQSRECMDETHVKQASNDYIYQLVHGDLLENKSEIKTGKRDLIVLPVNLNLNFDVMKLLLLNISSLIIDKLTKKFGIEACIRHSDSSSRNPKLNISFDICKDIKELDRHRGDPKKMKELKLSIDFTDIKSEDLFFINVNDLVDPKKFNKLYSINNSHTSSIKTFIKYEYYNSKVTPLTGALTKSNKVHKSFSELLSDEKFMKLLYLVSTIKS